MQPRPEMHYDAATAISQGRREEQEDAISTDFQIGAPIGFAVLSDGMGGHAAGDVASKIIVTEVFSELKLQSGAPERFEREIGAILREAALSANQCLRGHVNAHPEARGMGATLVAPVFAGRRLYWISVGDSPLLLYRDGVLQRLNEDHSMAPQIDFMAEAGLIAAEVAHNHPDRGCLTSVLIGDEVTRIDCPSEPVMLRGGDVVIAASDGLQTLSEEAIAAVIARCGADAPAAEIAGSLLAEVERAEDPEQDNVTIAVVRIRDPEPGAQGASRAPQGVAAGRRGAGGATVLRPLQFLRRGGGAQR